jgi:hypothetical protein
MSQSWWGFDFLYQICFSSWFQWICYLNPLPDIHVFFTHFCCLKLWGKHYWRPQHLFLFEKCCLKSDHLFGDAPIQKIHQGVARRGMCPLLFRGLKPSYRKENFWLVWGWKWPQVDHKVTCIQRWKAFDAISIYWKVAALWNQIWWKKSTQNSDFLQFWDVPLLPYFSRRVIKSEIISKSLKKPIQMIILCKIQIKYLKKNCLYSSGGVVIFSCLLALRLFQTYFIWNKQIRWIYIPRRVLVIINTTTEDIRLYLYINHGINSNILWTW